MKSAEPPEGHLTLGRFLYDLFRKIFCRNDYDHAHYEMLAPQGMGIDAWPTHACKSGHCIRCWEPWCTCQCHWWARELRRLSGRPKDWLQRLIRGEQ